MILQSPADGSLFPDRSKTSAEDEPNLVRGTRRAEGGMRLVFSLSLFWKEGEMDYSRGWTWPYVDSSFTHVSCNHAQLDRGTHHHQILDMVHSLHLGRC